MNLQNILADAALPADTVHKLIYLQEHTQLSTAEIVSQAVEDLYFKIKQSPFEILEASGFIGCVNAETDLSENYKAVLGMELSKKYDHC